MPELLEYYLPIVIFMAVAAGIALALMASAFLIAVRRPDPEKLSAYECGFNAFDDARMKFYVRFYLVAILFLLGTEMDYKVEKLKAGFVFNNPNQTSACGCGESVQLSPAKAEALEAQ